MKFSLIFCLLLLLVVSHIFGQAVSISYDGSSPDSSAILDVKSTNKGVLIPRMTTSQRNEIFSPTNGLLVYDIDTQGFWFYGNNSWINVRDESRPISIISDTDGDTKIQVEANANENKIRFHVVGNEAMIIAENENVGIGSSSPVAKLEVKNGAVLFLDTVGLTPFSGAGTRMMWVPAKAAFRAGYVSGSQWNDSSIGKWSFVGGGWNNISSNECAFVGGGINNNATGFLSFVGGGANNFASSSSAFVGGGQANTASGGHSFIGGGFSLFARSSYEASFGVFNTDYVPANNNSDRIFVIGNGTSSINRSNAITVLKNGNLGIGTQSPSARLAVENGAILFEGTVGGTPISGFGTRMMWIPNKAAFRAGNITTSLWDDMNIGLRSFVGGGFNNNASNINSFVGGGQNNLASGHSSFSCGANNISSGVCTFLGGGQFNTASNTYASVVGGVVNLASGLNSFIGGGTQLLAKSDNEAVFGTFNIDFTPSGDSGDHLFVVGNGTSNMSRSNALTLHRNGNMLISGSLSQNSDVRLKKEITPLRGSLDKVCALNGYHYYWSDIQHSDNCLQTGLLAQEMEILMPELIRENTTGIKSIIYIGLIPYLVESLKELNQEKDTLNIRMEALLHENVQLHKVIKELTNRVASIEAILKE